MRTSRTAALAFGIALSIASVTACTLFVSLDGLSGDATDPTAEAAADAKAGGDTGVPDCGASVTWNSDPESCGACGHRCLGGACVSGRCQSVPLVQLADVPRYMASDADALYVGSYANESLSRVAKQGGTVTPLAAGIPHISGIVVDASFVYFTSDTGVRRVPKTGGAVEIVASLTGDIYELALDGSSVFFTRWGGVKNNGLLASAPATGGVPTTLATGLNGPEGLVVTADRVFVALSGGGGVVSVPRVDGGAVVSVGASPARRLVHDESFMYWTARDTANIGRAPLTGEKNSGIDIALAPAPSRDGSIGVDAVHVYWTVSVVSAGLYRAPKGGGGSAELVAPFAQPTGLVVDSDVLYVADAATRLISRIAK